MVIDYDAIGMRIKIARIRAKFSQARLADISGLSLTHISNIETGNTKLSLPSIVSLANALNLSVDALLCDNIVQSTPIYVAEAQEVLSDCSRNEVRIMVDILKATKSALQKKDITEKFSE